MMVMIQGANVTILMMSPGFKMMVRPMAMIFAGFVAGIRFFVMSGFGVVGE
jgi:hypothetical protein